MAYIERTEISDSQQYVTGDMVEDVARKLLWWDMESAWEDVMPSEDCFWALALPNLRANYLRGAREMLEIARKAVSE